MRARGQKHHQVYQASNVLEHSASSSASSSLWPFCNCISQDVGDSAGLCLF